MATMVSTPFVSNLHKVLKENAHYDVIKSEGEYKVKRQSLKARLFGKSQNQKEKIFKIAKILTKTLSELARMEIPQALEHPTVKTTRFFLKKIKRRYHCDSRIQKCWKELVAARLGIESKLISDDFLKFAREAHLERYLLEYNHKLKPNCIDFQIMSDGKYVDWKEISDSVCNSPKSSRCPSQPWRYGPKGLQNEDMYDWQTLRPYKHDDPTKWGEQYVFEYVVCASGAVRLQGDHAWFRLKTPKGEVYSVGLYRPGKRGSGDNFKFPFHVKPGYLMQPDVSEFWPDQRQSVQVKITKEQFEQIRSKVEQDKKEDKLTYALFGGNCSQYINNLAKIAGVKFPTKMHVIRYIMPKSILRITDKIGRVLPNIIKKILLAVCTPFLNLLLLALGAGGVDSTLKKHGVKVEPHIRSFKDLFRSSKHYFHPPLHFLKVIDEVKSWRKKQLEKMQNASEKKKKLIALSVPEKYRVG